MYNFRKRPIIIKAERQSQAFIVETLEGEMRGHAGDWLITGIQGEQYPCAHEIFMQTYEPADDKARDYLEGQE